MSDIQNIYFVESYDPNINGVSIYEQQMINILSLREDVALTIIIDGSPTERPIQSIRDGIRIIYYPLVRYNKTEIISSFLMETISTSKNMIFVVNYFPGSFMAEAINTVFPKSTLVHVVHDMPWLTLCKGDIEKYISYMKTYNYASSESMGKKIYYITIDMINTFHIAYYIIALCQDSFEVITKLCNIPEHKVILIHNGLPDTFNKVNKMECNLLRKSWNLPLEKKIIVVTGRLSLSKGTDRILHLMCELFKHDLLSKWHLVYAGPDKTNNWFPTKFNPHITHLGPFSQKEVIMLLSISDVGIIASRHEQCSYSGIEMLMCNLPVLFVPGAFGVDNMFTEVGIPYEQWIPFLKKRLTSTYNNCKSRKCFIGSYTFNEMKSRYFNLIDNIKNGQKDE